ncbi:hypothetical protein FOBRF1_006731 [Fusarium oxysporum]
MDGKRIRNLKQQWVTDIAPRLPPPPPPDAPLDYQAIRDLMGRMKEGKDKALDTVWKHLKENVQVENIRIPLRDGHLAELRIFKPVSPGSANLQVYCSFHGGAFIAGSNDTEDLINRQLAAAAGVVVFSLDYRLAPEHDVVDVIFKDAEDGLKWVYAHAAEYGGNPAAGIIVGGTSVGGGMAVMLAYRSKDLGIPVKGVIGRQPALIMNFDTKPEWEGKRRALEENADAPMINKDFIIQVEDLLKIPTAKHTDPWNFPIWADNLEVMPPTYLVGAGCDPFADDVLLYSELLTKAGVPNKAKIYEGVPHGFHSYHELQEAKDEMQETAEGLKWLIQLSGSN